MATEATTADKPAGAEQNFSWLTSTGGGGNATDLGNAERFARANKDGVRYDRISKKWMAWDGRRWSYDLGEDIARCKYLQMARGLYLKIRDARGLDNKKELLRSAAYAESTAGMNAALAQAKLFPHISMHINDFDKNPYLLNCLNGTVDLKTGNKKDHDPNDMMTKLAPVNFDPKATSEVWCRVLNDATQGNVTLQDFLQISAGYTLTGDTSEERVFFAYGPTGSCKSTFLEPIKVVLGDYAKTADFTTFIRRKYDSGPRNDIARLAGARFVTTSEIDSSKELDENLFKRCSGRNTVSARFLYKELFEFQPQFKLWMEANEVPRIRDTDDGSMWRRLLRIPFDNPIPIEKQDKKIKTTLLDTEISGPAILAWLVQGCLRWQQEGLVIPYEVKQSTDEYRESQEDLRDFLDDMCEFGEDNWIEVSKMRSAYEKWAKDNGVRYTLGRMRFNGKLEARKCRRETKRIKYSTGASNTAKCWIGVKLCEW